VVAAGTPEDVARSRRSHTGSALRPLLNGHTNDGNGHKPAQDAGARRGKKKKV
jgi:hypothetical protein